MQKLIFIIDTLQHGGAERVVCNLANEFSLKNYNVLILPLSSYGNSCFYTLVKNVKVISILKNPNEKLNHISKIYRLRKLFKKDKKAIYISFLPHICIYTFISSLFLKTNIFLSERSDPNQYPLHYKIFLKLAFKKATGSIFQSKQSMSFYFKKKKENCAIILNPVVFQLKPQQIHKREKKIFSVGRLDDAKNFKLLINAFEIFLKNNFDYKLEIYGDGPLKNELNALIKSKNLDKRIKLMGIKQNWHAECFRYACYVCSSNYEGMSNSLEEAACLGIPSISTNCPSGGNAELLNYGEYGLLVPVNDEIALSNAIEKIVINNLEFDYKKLFQNCSIKSVALKWQNFILKCINTK